MDRKTNPYIVTSIWEEKVQAFIPCDFSLTPSHEVDPPDEALLGQELKHFALFDITSPALPNAEWFIEETQATPIDLPIHE
jgi:hypothetical protein